MNLPDKSPQDIPNNHAPALGRVKARLAFSLIEVTLALGIAAFCLMALLTLLPVGLNSNQTSANQTTAASFARSIVGDLLTTPITNPKTDATSPVYHFVIPAAAGTVTHTLFLTSSGMASGAMDTAAASGSAPIYRAMVTFNTPTTPSKPVTNVHLLITWPALADPNPSTGSTIPPVNPPQNYAGSLEIATAIDRN